MTRLVRKMCCNGDGVFVQMTDGSCWWRRHEWLGDVWQPVAAPGGAAFRRTVKPRRGVETTNPSPRRQVSVKPKRESR